MDKRGEYIMNRNVSRIVSKVLIIGGLVTTAGSIYDNAQNKTLNDENEARQRITQELRSAYNIDVECVSLLPTNFPSVVCQDIVKGNSDKEEKKEIVTKFYSELEQRFSDVPSDPEAKARGLRDGLGALGGLLIAAAGSAIRSSKERGG